MLKFSTHCNIFPRRCLNRDHPGQILLHLCVSMLFMNASFLAGGSRRAHIEVCAAVAVLVHYFLLTSLAWMCVEATNMYQLLVHVFASSESHFMLKRAILAWGKKLHIPDSLFCINTLNYVLENGGLECPVCRIAFYYFQNNYFALLLI